VVVVFRVSYILKQQLRAINISCVSYFNIHIPLSKSIRVLLTQRTFAYNAHKSFRVRLSCVNHITNRHIGIKDGLLICTQIRILQTQPALCQLQYQFASVLTTCPETRQ